MNYSYLYNIAGQLTKDTNHGKTYDYSYDRTGQLKTSTINGTLSESFSYDKNGNRTNSTGFNGSQTYSTGAGNQLMNDGKFSYLYDGEGNLSNKTEIATGKVRTYTWDYRNRLVKVEEKSLSGVVLPVAEFKYDAQGRRIAEIANGKVLRVVYDQNNTWADYDTTGSVIARYLFSDKTDEILARWQTATGRVWYLSDKIGTVHDLANSTGTIISNTDYSAFGQMLSHTNGSQSDRFTFTGRELITSIGDYYYRARFYNATMSRFLSQDPAGFIIATANLYTYASNSPNKYSDPSGLFFAEELSTIAYIGVGAVSIAVLDYVFVRPVIEIAICLIPGDYRHLYDFLDGLRKIVSKPLEYTIDLIVERLIGPTPFEISADFCNKISTLHRYI